MGQFSGKVAVVTGAASGIGLAVAQRFARDGACVLLGDISVKAGEAAAREIVKGGGRAAFIRTDVASQHEANALVDGALREFGRLDFAANIAGYPQGGGIYCPIEIRERTIAVNLMGTINCVAAQAMAMKESGGGSIVNCSSVAGTIAHHLAPYYVAAKFGVTGFTKAAALELVKFKIRVNVIAPGTTRTNGTLQYHGDKLDSLGVTIPIGHLGEAEDHANAVAWLCSDQASFITGALIPVDGGQTAGVHDEALAPTPSFVTAQLDQL